MVVKKGIKMKIEIKIDKNYSEPELIIYTDKVTDEVSQLVKQLSNKDDRLILAGFKDEKVYMLDLDKIYRIYSSLGKVYAEYEDTTYQLRLRLYEIEKRLEDISFARISNNEIINLKKVKDFDLSFQGTICVLFLNKKTTYVSRRYVSKIKQLLGIGGNKNEKNN